MSNLCATQEREHKEVRKR